MTDQEITNTTQTLQVKFNTPDITLEYKGNHRKWGLQIRTWDNDGNLLHSKVFQSTELDDVFQQAQGDLRT